MYYNNSLKLKIKNKNLTLQLNVLQLTSILCTLYINYMATYYKYLHTDPSTLHYELFYLNVVMYGDCINTIIIH